MSDTRKFRKKPVVIEAFKLGTDSMPDWFCARVSDCTITFAAPPTPDQER